MFFPLALPRWEHLKGHNLLAPSNATVVSLGPACSPVMALAGAGDPSIALEPSLDKQESKGCLMEKVGAGHVPLQMMTSGENLFFGGKKTLKISLSH